MSRLKELRSDQREERTALLCEMFTNEDAAVVFERERDELQGRDLTPVVKHLNSLLRQKLQELPASDSPDIQGWQ